MKYLLEHYHLLFVMTILTAAAILLKCFCAIIYQMLLRESEQMNHTKNKWLRSIHTKYEAYYKLKNPVYRTDTFLQTYLEQYHFLGISMKSLENFDYFCAIIVTGCTLFGIMCGIYYELPGNWILIHSMTLVLFLAFLMMSELIFQVRHRKKILYLQLLNYFENHLRAKLEGKYLYPEQRSAYQQEYFQTKTIPKETAGTKETSEYTAQETDRNTRLPSSPADTFRTAQGQLTPDMQELLDSLRTESKITEELQETQDKLSAAATQERYRLVEEIIKEYL